jgi:O-antigen/teichoic acid export membrane protein
LKSAVHSSIPFSRYAGYVSSVAGARTAGILISSLTFPYLVRRLGVEGYGQWSYVVAVCAFLNIVADPGINLYITQHIAANREAGFELIPDVVFLRLLGSLLAGAVLLVVAWLEVHLKIRQLLLLYGIGILLVNLIAADHLLGALELFHLRSALTVVQQLLYAITIFVFVRTPQDIVWLPIGILLSSAITALIAWTTLWRKGVRPGGTLHPARWKRILVPSFHYAASTLMSNIYHRSGHLLVRWFLGDFALGLYAAATRLVDLLRGFVIIVLQVLTPRMALAISSGAGLRRLARFATTVVAVISIPLTIGLMGTAHLLVPWVLGSKYMADASLLRWLATYLITAPAASLFAGTILFSMGRHRAYLASTAGGAMAGGLLYLVLIPIWGLTGAAVAFVLAELVVASIALLKIPELYDSWKNPVLGIALASALLMLIAIRVANAYTSQAIVVISVGACIYVMSSGWFVRKWIAEQ